MINASFESRLYFSIRMIADLKSPELSSDHSNWLKKRPGSPSLRYCPISFAVFTLKGAFPEKIAR